MVLCCIIVGVIEVSIARLFIIYFGSVYNCIVMFLTRLCIYNGGLYMLCVAFDITSLLCVVAVRCVFLLGCERQQYFYFVCICASLCAISTAN